MLVGGESIQIDIATIEINTGTAVLGEPIPIERLASKVVYPARSTTVCAALFVPPRSGDFVSSVSQRLAIPGVAALVAVGLGVAQAPIASANVTALTYTNASQTVVVGTAMQDALATPTGTPYTPQLLGTTGTWLGPSTAGTPTFAYTFPTGFRPGGIVQGDATFSHDFFMLETSNTASKIKRVDRSTGTVTEQTITNMNSYSVGPLQQADLNNSSRYIAMDGADRLYVNMQYYYAVGTDGCAAPAPFCSSQQVLRLERLNAGSAPNDWTITGAMRLPGGDATNNRWPSIPGGITVSNTGDIFLIASGSAPDVASYVPGAIFSIAAGSITANPVDGTQANLVSTATYAGTNWSFPRSSVPAGIAFNPANDKLVMVTTSGTVQQTTGTISSLGATADVIADDTTLAQTGSARLQPAWDGADNLYYRYGNCVKYVAAASFATPPGTPVTPGDLGGNCATAGFVNGVGPAARFAFQDPTNTSAASFAFDSQNVGTLIMTDPGNTAVRQIGTIGYSVAPALQVGITLASNGTISGTPSITGLTAGNLVQNHTVSYRNLDLSEATAAIQLTYVVPPTALTMSNNNQSVLPNTAITTMSPDDTPGTSAALGFPAPTFTISPALPAGVTIDPTTGAISGTPSALSPQTTYTVTAANQYGSTTATVQLAVLALLPPDTPSLGVLRGSGFLTAIADPANTGGAVASYVFTAADNGVVVATCTAFAPATSCNLSPLTDFTNYVIDVVAVNAAGSSAASTAITVSPSPNTPSALPPAATAPVAVAGTGSATVTVAPAFQSGAGWAAATTVVTAAPGGATCTVSGSLGSCTVTGLTGGVSYTFTAVATNLAGSAAASSPSNAVTPTTPTPPTPPTPVTPSAPGSVTVASGNGSASVSWSAPANPGTFPVTQYRAVASPGGATCLVPASSTTCTLSPLTNGTTYTVSVSALSGAGWGAAATSAPFTPGASAPATPSVTSVLAGNRSVTVTVAAGTGGGPLTSYRVTAAPGGATCTVTAPATSCVVSGLTNGTAYAFIAIATGPGGTSGSSAASSPVTPVAPITPTPAPLPGPLAPGQSNLQQGGQTVPVTVTPNGQSNGLVVNAPGFTMTLQGENGQGRPLPLRDGVLVLEQDRTLRTAGTGFFPNTDVELYLDPPAMGDGSMLRANAGSTYLGSVPADSLGDFDGTVQIDPSVGVGDHVVQAIGVTQDNVERAMSLGVRVEEAVATRPGPVRDLTVVSKTKSTVKLSWKTPLDDGGSPITKYKVRHRLMGEERYKGKLQVTGLAATVKSLTPGKTYYIRVKAVNAVGTGPSDRFVKVRLPKAPAS